MIVFKNKGNMDLTAITTFGISAKENENPIGFFGTGLKYAIAILMREDQGLSLVIDGKCYGFVKVENTFRGKTFDFIEMRGEDGTFYKLPFTTELGKNWEVWQAYRELYCNTLDEGGTVEKTNEVNLEKNHTVIIVSGEKIETCHMNRTQYFLHLDSDLLVNENHKVQIYDKPSRHLYFKGIRVHELHVPALFTYNFLSDVSLTEDREMKYSGWEISKIIHCAAMIKNENVLMRMLMAGDNTLEGNLDWSNADEFSKECEKIIGREFEHNNEGVNASAYKVHRKKNKLSAKHYKPHSLTDVESKMLKRCAKIINKVFPHFHSYEYMVVENLGTSTMALAEIETSKYYLSKECFKQGTKFLLSTMIEELTHLHYHYSDHSRAMQTHLFDTITTLIEEYVIKEPV